MTSIPLISTIFGLAAAISWGTADFFAAKASKRTGPVAAAFWVAVIGTFSYAVIYLINPGGLSWTSAGILYAAGAGVLMELGLYLFYRGLHAGPVSIVSPVSSAYPLVSAAAVLIFFHASLSGQDITGIAIIVIGIIAASGAFGNKESKQKLTPGVLYGISTLVLWGVAYAMLGQAVSEIGWEKSALIDTSAGLVALTIVLLLTARHELRTSLKLAFASNKLIVVTAFLQLFGGVILTIGLAHTRSSAVLIAISATYPALTIFLALKHFGEKRQIISIIGSLVTIIGVIILTVE